MNWIRQRLWPVLRQIAKRWSDDDGWLLSAAMAYYGAFSLFPLCLVLIAGLGIFTQYSNTGQDAQQQLIEIAEQNLSPWVAGQLENVLSGVQTNARLGGPLGLVVLVIAALGIFRQLETIFDRIWGVKNGRPKGIVASIKDALIERLVAFLMLVGVGGFIVVIFILNLTLNGLRAHVEFLSAAGPAWSVVQYAISILLYTCLFSVIYKVIPKTPVGWREAVIAGLLVAIVWQVGQQVLSLFVIGEKYSAYGVVGSFIALMVWMYYASVVVFLGAEVVQTLRGPVTEDAGNAANF